MRLGISSSKPLGQCTPVRVANRENGTCIRCEPENRAYQIPGPCLTASVEPDREVHGTHVSVRDTAEGCLQVPGWTLPQFPCLTALGRTICFSFSACLDFSLISHNQPCPPPFPCAAGPTVQRHELADRRRAAATVLHELHLGHDDVVLEHRAAARAHCIAARRVKLDIRAAATAAYAARHGGAVGPSRRPAAPLPALRPRPLARKPRRTASV